MKLTVGIAAVAAVALLASACGGGDTSASDEVAAAGTGTTVAPSSVASTPTSAPPATTTTVTDAPTTTTEPPTTTTTAPPIVGPRQFADFVVEWRDELDELDEAQSRLKDVSGLADVWAEAGEPVPDADGNATWTVRVDTAPAVELTAVADGADGPLVRLDIAVVDGEPAVEGEIDPLASAYSAALYTLRPRPDVGNLARDIDEVFDSPPRRREAFVLQIGHVFEVGERTVAVHLDAGDETEANLRHEIIDVTGPPLLLGQYIDDIGKTDEWTVEQWGSCSEQGSMCVVYVDGKGFQTRLLGNQVRLEHQGEGRYTAENPITQPNVCSDTGSSFTIEWIVVYDLTFAAGELVSGVIQTVPVDDDLRQGNDRCLTYRYVHQLGDPPTE